MIRYIAKNLLLKNLISHLHLAHLSLTGIVALVIGVLIILKINQTSNKTTLRIFVSGVIVLVFGIINNSILPLKYQVAFLKMSSIFPIALLLMMISFIVFVVKSEMRMAKYWVISACVSSFLSSGFLLQSIAPNLTKHIPVANSILVKGNTILNQISKK
ncbi:MULTISPECIES: hypothetical protein [Lactococcus]|uniref:Putative membrane protein n=1 Tax=Lactococcus lactis subsp. cremoris TaxID=1359 RepID=A0A1V0PDA3_LACLC|nr:hypothetical protein [Lactococcus lactis]MDT2938590.1 hypothetical protein [Lactococcus lactis]